MKYNPVLMRTRKRSRIAPLLLILGVGLGVGLAYLLNVPTIERISPLEATGRVSARAPIEVVFNRPMDSVAVEASLTIRPARPGHFEWPDLRTVRFVPAQEWPRGVPISVSLAAGARSSRGLQLLRGRDWTFQVDAPRVAFLHTDPSDQVPNVWAVQLDGTGAVQLTFEPLGVYEFGVSPDGTRIAYAVIRADGGADLREITLDGQVVRELLSCPGQACRRPAYSPTGSWLAFERRSMSADFAGDPVFTGSEVALLELATLTVQALPVRREETTRAPTWIPTGQVAFVNEDLRAIGWYDLGSGAVDYVPDLAVEMGTWSPDGAWLVYSEILLPEHAHDHAPATPEAQPTATATGDVTPAPTPTYLVPTPEPTVSPEDVFYTHLLRYNVLTNELLELTDVQYVEDTSAVYSPSGEYLAFARKYVDSENWTPGRQLWIMNTGSAESQQLTADGIYNHSAFVWSPDEQTLVFMRFNVADYNAPPQIWAIDRDGRNLRLLADSGYLPAWLP